MIPKHRTYEAGTDGQEWCVSQWEGISIHHSTQPHALLEAGVAIRGRGGTQTPPGGSQVNLGRFTT